MNQAKSIERYGKLSAFIIMLLLACLPLSAANTQQTNAQQARKLFNEVYQMVFGPQGSSLQYDVNIIGIYKTNGTIWYKGKKMRYKESRYLSWNNGETAWMVDSKKKTVGIFRADDDNKDKYLSKFKYNLNDYEYSWGYCKDGIQVKLMPKNSSLIGIRQVIGVLDRNTHHPLYLKIKVAFFWTTVKILSFKTGNISDNTFIFPHQSFKGYEFTDHRKD